MDSEFYLLVSVEAALRRLEDPAAGSAMTPQLQAPGCSTNSFHTLQQRGLVKGLTVDF